MCTEKERSWTCPEDLPGLTPPARRSYWLKRKQLLRNTSRASTASTNLASSATLSTIWRCVCHHRSIIGSFVSVGCYVVVVVAVAVVVLVQTWRQLWRVMEMSDMVLLIADIRHPVMVIRKEILLLHQVVFFFPLPGSSFLTISL